MDFDYYFYENYFLGGWRFQLRDITIAAKRNNFFTSKIIDIRHFLENINQKWS